jgi:two-component system chemotaxis sensor kinase CheA
MTEFMEQFLIESRELVEGATGDFLALEETPGDRERLDSVFRAVHTLKGAAGIMDFDAMGRALHAVEDVLSAVRAGASPVTSRLVDDGLHALDRVTAWLDVMEATGEPPPDAGAAADAIVARFAAPSSVEPPPRDPPPGEPSGAWLDGLLARHPAQAGAARLALRYAPDPGCFFGGDDPLSLVAGLPGILAVEVEPATPWPALDLLDPFACNLVIRVLLQVGEEEIAELLEPARGQVEIRALRRPGSGPALPAPLRELLEAQILLLAEPTAEGATGRIASAGRVAANVLRHAGCASEADALDRATTESLAAGSPGRLTSAIAHARDGMPPPGADRPAEAPAAPVPDPEPSPGARMPQEIAARALRVDAERIDALVTLAGELTVAKNALAHAVGLAREGTDPAALAVLLRDQHAGLDRLVGELQRAVLNIRVLPLGHVFNRFPRLVREIAAGLGKSVRLVVEGEATEADKAVVEALFEPLLHGVRNALDHGIEPASERRALGKAAVATIRLRAAREGEGVLVEVEDDGRGIDAAAIRAVAAGRGLLPPHVLAALTDEQAIDLAFAPGFSTAAAVTDLSGRGVGMDAVRRAVERMGGRVGIESRPGRGATLRMTLPFTLMLTRVMTVEAGGQVFGIPLDTVVETLRLPRNRIVPVGAGRAFVLRDRTVPLVSLAEALGGAADEADRPETSVVIVNLGGQPGGLAVEQLGLQMEVMLKPVDGLLADVPAIAGTTLLGDGRVLIVLDVQELLE